MLIRSKNTRHVGMWTIIRRGGAAPILVNNARYPHFDGKNHAKENPKHGLVDGRLLRWTRGLIDQKGLLAFQTVGNFAPRMVRKAFDGLAGWTAYLDGHERFSYGGSTGCAPGADRPSDMPKHGRIVVKDIVFSEIFDGP